jgi:cobalt-zinc-cadmium efflux system outer membrane protein
MIRHLVTLIALLACFFDADVYAQVAPQTPLTLQVAIETYLQNNLELQIARTRLERSRADQIAARLRPNPTVTFTAENLAVSGPTSFGRLYEVGATYSETLELGGKRTQREKAAEATISAAEAQLEDTLRRGVAEVKRLYFEALLARYVVDSAADNRQTFDQLVQFNSTRFQEGAIPEVDLIKVRLERLKVDSAIGQSNLGLRQSTIHLLERIGVADLNSRFLVGELTFSPVSSDLASFQRLASTERTDIRAALAEVNAVKERLALARVLGKPDMNPFAGYKRVGNDNTLLFGVSMQLKVRDHNQADVARVEADLKSAELRLQLVKNHALAEVEMAYAALQTATGLVQTFQRELLQQADETRAIAISAYEEGGTELLPVLEAQRTRAEVRQQYLKALFDYRASIVQLELATGRDIQP